MPNGPVLGVDTSGPYCAAAIWMDGAVIAESREDMARGQVERLAPFIEALLSDARITWADLAALGVSVGPGNFTGIRISLSFVRGLALGLDIPAVGVSAFESLADTLPDHAPTLLCFAPPGRTAHLVQAWADGAA
ncbi:MAG: tRNA (adenosine(37)-N6)-threonylcarbamoyltransferase complex dimerization subunit type 1 TsaB, partial [Pseudomonadota bacterium]